MSLSCSRRLGGRTLDRDDRGKDWADEEDHCTGTDLPGSRHYREGSRTLAKGHGFTEQGDHGLASHQA